MKLIKEKKKISFVICIVILLVIIIFMLFKNFGENLTLEQRLERISKEFYSEHYYKEVSKTYNEKDKTTYLKQLESIGVKLSLDDLRRYRYSNIDINKELEYFNTATCDLLNTIVIIYPEDPYGETNYKIDIKLDCEQ